MCYAHSSFMNELGRVGIREHGSWSLALAGHLKAKLLWERVGVGQVHPM